MKSTLLSPSNLALIALLGQSVQFLATAWTVKGVDLTTQYVTLQNPSGILSTHRDNLEDSHE